MAASRRREDEGRRGGIRRRREGTGPRASSPRDLQDLPERPQGRGPGRQRRFGVARSWPGRHNARMRRSKQPGRGGASFVSPRPILAAREGVRVAARQGPRPARPPDPGERLENWHPEASTRGGLCPFTMETIRRQCSFQPRRGETAPRLALASGERILEIPILQTRHRERLTPPRGDGRPSPDLAPRGKRARGQHPAKKRANRPKRRASVIRTFSTPLGVVTQP